MFLIMLKSDLFISTAMALIAYISVVLRAVEGNEPSIPNMIATLVVDGDIPRKNYMKHTKSQNVVPLKPNC